MRHRVGVAGPPRRVPVGHQGQHVLPSRLATTSWLSRRERVRGTDEGCRPPDRLYPSAFWRRPRRVGERTAASEKRSFLVHATDPPPPRRFVPGSLYQNPSQNQSFTSCILS